MDLIAWPEAEKWLTQRMEAIQSDLEVLDGPPLHRAQGRAAEIRAMLNLPAILDNLRQTQVQ